MLIGARAKQRGQVPQFDQHRRKRLAHFVMQFPRQRPALGFLRLNQARREVFKLAAGLGHLEVLRVRLILQPQNAPHADGGHCQSQGQRHDQGNADASLKCGQQPHHLIIRSVQLLLVQRGRAVSQREHVLPARKYFVAQKVIAQLAALHGGPFKNGVENIPILRQFILQRPVMLNFLGLELAAIGLHGAIHLAADLLQAGAVGIGALTFRLQQVIAHIGPGQVDLRADIV
jgi:hypothetical protein